MQGVCAVSHYLDRLYFQECVYPENHIKMRCLENHDQPRICSFVKDDLALENYTAFLYFLKGTTLLYAGQEYRNDHVPSLFDKDVIIRNTYSDIRPLFQKLYKIKKKFHKEDNYYITRS